MPTTYGFRFINQPPIYLREREDAYCLACYRRMWPSIPPSDWHRKMLAIRPITRVAEARGTTCAQCGRPLDP